jgi:hypothetical protein
MNFYYRWHQRPKSGRLYVHFSSPVVIAVAEDTCTLLGIQVALFQELLHNSSVSATHPKHWHIFISLVHTNRSKQTRVHHKISLFDITRIFHVVRSFWAQTFFLSMTVSKHLRIRFFSQILSHFTSGLYNLTCIILQRHLVSKYLQCFRTSY